MNLPYLGRFMIKFSEFDDMKLVVLCFTFEIYLALKFNQS